MLQFDFLAVALLHETDTYGGGGGGVSQQLVWLFICLSRASGPGVIILLRVCVKGDDDPEQRGCERGKGQRTGDGRAPRGRGAERLDRP